MAGRGSIWLKRAGRRILGAAVLALAGCGGGAEEKTAPVAAERPALGAATPAGVAAATTIDFQRVANYAAPPLPAYFDASVAALDNGSSANAVNDRVATLGRVLFYDLRLSTNNRVSCATCHQQAFGFTDPMRFSNGISTGFTTDAHAMRLANARYWKPGSMFWDRRVPSVEAQAGHPITNLVEMGWGGAAGSLDDLIAKMSATPYYPDLFAWAFGSPAVTRERMQQALGQFVRAMISSSSRWDDGYARVFSPAAPGRALDADLANFTPEENRGRHLFMTAVSHGGAGCSACHLPPTFALAGDARSNGLDAGERRLFKAPSLRSVGLTGPYMHDGRFATLAEVVDHYDHGVREGPALDRRLLRGGRPQRLNLGAADRAAIVAFLMTLSDPVLTTDGRFANPFRGEAGATPR